MACIFSVLLSRLTGGSSELYEVLGTLPGVNKADLVGDTHGGLVETSQLLALHPEWIERDYGTLPRRTVDMFLREHGGEPSRFERGKPAAILTTVKAFRGALRFFRAETYAGAPGAASPELGERILDTLAAKAAEAASEIAAVAEALRLHQSAHGASVQPPPAHPGRHRLTGCEDAPRRMHRTAS
jgi:hypothetical protein